MSKILTKEEKKRNRDLILISLNDIKKSAYRNLTCDEYNMLLCLIRFIKIIGKELYPNEDIKN